MFQFAESADSGEKECGEYAVLKPRLHQAQVLPIEDAAYGQALIQALYVEDHGCRSTSSALCTPARSTA